MRAAHLEILASLITVFTIGSYVTPEVQSPLSATGCISEPKLSVLPNGRFQSFKKIIYLDALEGMNILQ